MTRFRSKLWVSAGAVLCSAAILAGCGGEDVIKEEPTPAPSNTAALAPPGAENAGASDREPGGDPTTDRGERLPDGVGESGQSGEVGGGSPD